MAPESRQKTSDATAPSRRSRPHPPSASILLVEDEALVAQYISFRLRKFGFEVAAIAHSGEQALRDAERTHPDLALMDVTLAGDMDGIETATALRRDFGIPSVFLTSSTDADTIERAKAAAPLGYLIKPFEEPDLRSTVEIALSTHRAQARSARMERLFLSACSALPIGVLIADPDGNVLHANIAAARLLDRKDKELEGTPIAAILGRPLPHPPSLKETKDPPPVRFPLPAPAAGKDPVADATIPAQANEAGTVVLLLPRDGGAGNGGNPLASLLAESAHDLNNLLGIIGGYASSLTEGLLPNTRARDDASRVLEATRHATDVAKRLLGASRSHDSAANHPNQRISAAGVVQTAANLAAGPLTDRGIRLKVREQKNELFVLGDAHALTDAIMDLLFNAADASPRDGDVSIRIFRRSISRPDTVFNPIARPGPHVVIEVGDSGSGITPEAQKHLFEPFFTTHGDRQHIGLGLVSVRNCVLRCGGWIRVHSLPGKGTRIALYLPAADDAHRATSDAPVVDAPATILAVDDDAEALELIRQTLEPEGYRVVATSNVNDALSFLRKSSAHAPTASIVDLFMPGKGGAPIVQELTRNDPKAPVLVISGFPREFVRQRLPRGAWAFLQKPFDADQLLASLRRIAARDT